MSVEQIYLEVAQKQFRKLKNQGEKALSQLNNDDIHWIYQENDNSIAVIVKHVSGNMLSRWTDFLTTDGEKANRHRDQEFEDTLETKEEMMEAWEQGWTTLFHAVDHLTADDLIKNIRIRSEAINVIEAIERQLTHYASHIGQIIFIAKQLKGDQWKTLSIPKGQSEQYAQEMKKKFNS